MSAERCADTGSLRRWQTSPVVHTAPRAAWWVCEWLAEPCEPGVGECVEGGRMHWPLRFVERDAICRSYRYLAHYLCEVIERT